MAETRVGHWYATGPADKEYSASYGVAGSGNIAARSRSKRSPIVSEFQETTQRFAAEAILEDSFASRAHRTAY